MGRRSGDGGLTKELVDDPCGNPGVGTNLVPGYQQKWRKAYRASLIVRLYCFSTAELEDAHIL